MSSQLKDAILHARFTSISNNLSVWLVNLFGQGRGLCGSRGALSTGRRRLGGWAGKP